MLGARALVTPAAAWPAGDARTFRGWELAWWSIWGHRVPPTTAPPGSFSADE